MEQEKVKQDLPIAGFVTVKAGPAQVERLASLGVLSAAQLEAGRKAGGLAVQLPANLVANWQAQNEDLAQLAVRIHEAGLARPARLFLGAGRPLSFVGSQVLLVAQPFLKLLFGSADSASRYSRLLEDRSNLDWLLTRLEHLEISSPSGETSKTLDELTRKERSKV